MVYKRVPGGVVHELPADLRAALIANTTALAAWKDITVLARNEFICWVEDAKQQTTRDRRIRRTQEELEEGKRRPCCWPGCKHRERNGRYTILILLQSPYTGRLPSSGRRRGTRNARGTVTAVNSSRLSSSAALVTCAASLVVTLAACGSDTDKSPTTSSVAGVVASSVTATASAAASSCPTAAAEAGGTPDWTLPGATGSVAVTGSTDTAAPHVDVKGPFSVTETQVQTLRAGDGPVVADAATVSVCYMGVNGRDGTVFDSSYERGAPVEFPLNGVVPGFQKAIAGQKVGSTVAVAMTSADGYPDGQPSAGIQKGDTLIFAIKILDASS